MKTTATPSAMAGALVRNGDVLAFSVANKHIDETGPLSVHAEEDAIGGTLTGRRTPRGASRHPDSRNKWAHALSRNDATDRS